MATAMPKSVLSLIASTIGGEMFAIDDLLHLYVNEVVIEPETVLADFTECGLTNYGAKTLEETWLTGIDPETGSGIVKYPINLLWPGLLQDEDPETVYGWYITDVGSTVLKGCGSLDTSIVVGDAPVTVGVLVWLLLAVTGSQHQEEIN